MKPAARLFLCPGLANLIALAALLSASPLAFSQVTASISGKIEDASGAGVSGVAVTLKSLETGATRTVTTGDGGDFRALSLPIGPYQVRAEKTGFKTATSRRRRSSRSARKRW